MTALRRAPARGRGGGGCSPCRGCWWGSRRPSAAPRTATRRRRRAARGRRSTSGPSPRSVAPCSGRRAPPGAGTHTASGSAASLTPSPSPPPTPRTACWRPRCGRRSSCRNASLNPTPPSRETAPTRPRSSGMRRPAPAPAASRWCAASPTGM
uniref:Uncharacterized protein n=1 Tax=Arundo donax TaxID=35708 RepID=A0A0A9CH31_ARUDO